MTRKEFINFAEHNIVVLDGATGSNLLRRGMPGGVCPEKWICEHPDVMIALQREYVEAGSHIIYAPTFSANRIKLKEYGLEKELHSINEKLVQISKAAAGERALVAGDLTMTGEQLAPMGSLLLEDLIDVYKEQIQCLEKAGVDLLVIETMLSLQECRAALIAAKETTDLAVMITLTFGDDGKTLFGTEPEAALVVLQSLGAAAVGVNCSAGPDRMLPIIKAMKHYAEIPIIAKPNAGLPALTQEGKTEYDMEKEDFVFHMKALVEAGAGIVGGCCGTTPEFIQALSDSVKGCRVPSAPAGTKRVLASERKIKEIPLDGSFLIIGERINPTGKKALQEDIRNGIYDRVLNFAKEQEDCGASVLDVNVGMSGICEKDVMLDVISEVGMASSLPLSIDSSHVEVIEAALRNYPGRALINSISLETEKFEKLLPIAKKYGALFILLPLSDEGLPKSIEEKKSIIQTVLQEALKQGFRKEDIIVDGLVATVGANKNAALETLETIRYCKQELGLATICGLSNISFGLPERTYVNSTFLTMAIGAGLTMAIANPSQELLVKSAYAADLLMNKEDADIKYIQVVQSFQKDVTESEVKKELGLHEQIYTDVLKGNKKQILARVKQYLDEGAKPSELLNNILIKAINEVGDLFDRKEYFLPQLIAAAEAMKKAIEYIEPMLAQDTDTSKMPVVVIATVEGDIHDIGKNLVALMLKNYGFRIIDLGKDVPKEEIVETAIKENADIIALSALMTTTMQEMKNVIDYAKNRGAKAKIIIGGAVITQEYADEIGADGYSKDAAEAVKLVKKLLQI